MLTAKKTLDYITSTKKKSKCQYLTKLLVPLMAVVVLLVGVTSAHSQNRDILKEVLDRGVLRVAVCSAVPPYSTMKANGEMEGYEIDMAKMIAKELGVEPKFTVVDAAGRVTALQTGKVDITICNFTANFVRSHVISFTDPYMVVGMVFFCPADRDDIKTIADINTSSKKVGFPRGSTQETLVPAAVPKTTIVRFSSMSDTLEALNSGRVDCSALDNIGTSGIMAANPGKYKLLPGRYSREDISIGLPKGDFEWWRLLQIWIRDFNLAGKNDALYKKWFKGERPTIFETF